MGILRYNERPSVTTTELPRGSRMSNTARSIGEWNPLMTTLLVWAISYTQQVASSGASGGALRIKKRTLQQYRDDGLVSYVTLPGKMRRKSS